MKRKRIPKQRVPHKGRTAARHAGARQIPHPHEHAAMAGQTNPAGRDQSGYVGKTAGSDYSTGPAGPSVGP